MKEGGREASTVEMLTKPQLWHHEWRCYNAMLTRTPEINTSIKGLQVCH